MSGESAYGCETEAIVVVRNGAGGRRRTRAIEQFTGCGAISNRGCSLWHCCVGDYLMKTLAVFLFVAAVIIGLETLTRQGLLCAALAWCFGLLAYFRIRPECGP